MMAGANIRLYGKVQGVGFRYFAKNMAIMYNIKGWVKNNADGSVEIKAEGSREDLGQFIVKLKTDNPEAIVSKIETQWLPGKNNYGDFRILMRD